MTSEADRLLRLKKQYLIPSVYHFYQNPPALVRGADCYVYDDQDREYLDCFSGVTVMSAGHSNPEITSAAIAQIKQLQNTTTIYLTAPMLELAEQLAAITPGDLNKFFFCASGSEANEAALLMATSFTQKNEIIYLKEGLHGRTKWAMSVTGIDMWRTDDNLVVTTHAIPGTQSLDSLEILEKKLREGKIAAVIAEPIQGNGGIIVPPIGYWQNMRELCTRYGALLIADEIQTGMNRTGTWFATDHEKIIPDIITMAKALGNGFPIAVCAVSERIAKDYRKPAGCTFGGNPIACRTALAVLKYHREHQLGDRSWQSGQWLINELRGLKDEVPLIKEVRGRGLMIGVELNDSKENSAAQLTDQILEEMKDRGFLIGKSGIQRNVITLMPPLIIQDYQLQSLVSTLKTVLQLKMQNLH